MALLTSGVGTLHLANWARFAASIPWNPAPAEVLHFPDFETLVPIVTCLLFAFTVWLISALGRGKTGGSSVAMNLFFGAVVACLLSLMWLHAAFVQAAIRTGSPLFNIELVAALAWALIWLLMLLATALWFPGANTARKVALGFTALLSVLGALAVGETRVGYPLGLPADAVSLGAIVVLVSVVLHQRWSKDAPVRGVPGRGTLALSVALVLLSLGLVCRVDLGRGVHWQWMEPVAVESFAVSSLHSIDAGRLCGVPREGLVWKILVRDDSVHLDGVGWVNNAAQLRAIVEERDELVRGLGRPPASLVLISESHTAPPTQLLSVLAEGQRGLFLFGTQRSSVGLMLRGFDIRRGCVCPVAAEVLLRSTRWGRWSDLVAEEWRC